MDGHCLKCIVAGGSYDQDEGGKCTRGSTPAENSAAPVADKDLTYDVLFEKLFGTGHEKGGAKCTSSPSCLALPNKISSNEKDYSYKFGDVFENHQWNRLTVKEWDFCLVDVELPSDDGNILMSVDQNGGTQMITQVRQESGSDSSRYVSSQSLLADKDDAFIRDSNSYLLPKPASDDKFAIKTFWVATSSSKTLFQFYLEHVPSNVVAAVYEIEHGSGPLCWIVLACVFLCMCAVTVFAYKAYTKKTGDDDAYHELNNIEAADEMGK